MPRQHLERSLLERVDKDHYTYAVIFNVIFIRYTFVHTSFIDEGLKWTGYNLASSSLSDHLSPEKVAKFVVIQAVPGLQCPATCTSR